MLGIDAIKPLFFTFPYCCKSTGVSYYNWIFNWICLSLNSSAINGSMGTKLGREVGGGHGIRLEASVSMETKQLPWHTKKAVIRLIYWADGRESLAVQ